MKKHKNDYLMTLGLVVVGVIFFYQTIFLGRLPVPTDTLMGLYHPWRDLYASAFPRGVPYKNFLITDPIRQQIPWRKIVIDDYKKGMWPAWNPYTFAGTSLIANIQAGAFYPLNVLFFIFSFPIAWSVLVMLQPVLAGIFFYLYVRNLKFTRLPAFLGAVAWMFSGFSVAWLTWGTIGHAVLWLPVLLLSIDNIFSLTSNKIAWLIMFMLAGVFTVFAGHIQIAAYVLGFAFIYGLARLIHSTHKKLFLLVLLGFLAIATVTIVTWQPLLSALSHSSRFSDSANWLKDGWFLPWQNLVQFLIPDFFGNPATLNYWGIWNYGEFIGYFGILPLLFAVYALTKLRTRRNIFFAGACIGALLFMLPTPLAKLPYELRIPLLSSIQPTRMMAILDFCLVYLSVVGFDEFLSEKNKRRSVITIMLVGILYIFAWISVIIGSSALLSVAKRNMILPSLLFGLISVFMAGSWVIKKKYERIIMFIFFAVTLFDLFRFGWKFTPFTPVEYFFPMTKTIQFLQNQPKPFRIVSLDNEILPPNVSTYFNLETPEGYDPIYDSHYEQFIAALNRNAPNIQGPFGFNRILTVQNVQSRLFPLLNTKYVLSLRDQKDENLKLVFQEGETRVYQYAKSLPRVFVADSVFKNVTDQETINMLYSPKFDLQKQAVSEISWAGHPMNLSEKMNFFMKGNTLTIMTKFQHEHFVIILNAFDAGWRANMENTGLKIYRTDYVFQGLLIPAGNHTIAVSYSPI